LVLGGGEVTLLDMTSAYGDFATDGVRYEPVSILKIEDAAGNVIEDNSESQRHGSQVLPRETAQKINDILSDVQAREPLGDNGILNFPGHDVALKTGTTNEYRDAWTIGYTPNIVIGMWAGNNDNTPMVKKISGLIVGPMWAQVMQYAIANRQDDSFSRSEYTQPSKPALLGQWQLPGSDGHQHEILYWVNKDDPTGPPPQNPASDPQYIYWDTLVQNWLMQYGFISGNQNGGQ
jgi:membrane peptidoglycan carboxypeptidase